jgi:hypothetical protein
MNFLGIKQVSGINFVLKIISETNFSVLLTVWTALTINRKFRGFCARIPRLGTQLLWTAGWFPRRAVVLL